MITRVQRKRIKDWRKPENALYVGRPTKWGNPFAKHEDLALYRGHIEQQIKHGHLDLAELKGRDLMCFCPLNVPCHADILIEMLNNQPA